MLRDLKCVPCRGGEASLGDAEIQEYLAQVPDWKVIEREGIKRLERVFKFDTYAEALAFTSKVGKMADDEDHHPAILTEWGKVTVSWWTHTVKGLHRNDLIMAAKTDTLYG